MSKNLISKVIAYNYDRATIINWVGYPAASVNSFQHDSGLGSLISNLRKVKVDMTLYDYASVGIVKKLRPLWLRNRLKPIWRTIRDSLDAGVDPPRSVALKLLFWGLFSFFIQRKVEKDVTKEMITKIAKDKPLFFGAKLWMGDGFLGSMRILKIWRIGIYGHVIHSKMNLDIFQKPHLFTEYHISTMFL